MKRASSGGSRSLGEYRLIIKPIRSGQTRRAKLFYLRDRTGKSVKLSHRHSEHTLTPSKADPADVRLAVRSRGRLLADPKRLGRWGENQALRFLRRRGLRTIARNFRCDGGELDLIVADPDGAVAFVEVKTRRNEDFAHAQAAVTPEKRQADDKGGQGLRP